MFRQLIIFLLLVFFFFSCAVRPYSYFSMIEESKSRTFLSKIKKKFHIYKMETVVTSPYFFSMEKSKILLGRESIKNIVKLCQKNNKRYFALLSPMELSNVDRSLVNTVDTLIKTIEVRSIEKEQKNNKASFKVDFILLDKPVVAFVVWDSEKF